MERAEALELLKRGDIRTWNAFRQANPDWAPDLSGEAIGSANLNGIDLRKANLCGTDLSHCLFLFSADLKDARFDVHTSFPVGFDPNRKGARFMSRSQVQHDDRTRSLIFISYAWANDRVVLAIREWLRERGLLTRIDRQDFFAGSRIRDDVIRVMQQCDVILIFLSQEAADRPWVEFEQELAADLEMEAKKEKRTPPRIIYVVIDDSQLPTVSERNRIAVFAKGKSFESVCAEIYHSILQLPRKPEPIDLTEWKDYVF
jgi:hypothetical protein